MTGPLPMVTSHGSPRDVGRAHGAAFASLVRASVDSCHQRIERVLKLPLADAQRFAARQGEQLAALDANLVAEMRGIAEGADVDPLGIVLLHVRTALSRMVEAGQQPRRDGQPPLAPEPTAPASLECTTLAVGPGRTSEGRVLAAQNWDMHPSYAPRAVVIRQRVDGEPGLMFIAEAGVLFSHGMNTSGVVILGNALYGTAAQAPDNGVPVQFTRRLAMRASSATAAADVIRSHQRAHAVNHLVADAQATMVDLEAMPNQVYDVWPSQDVLVHTNHPLSETARADVGATAASDRPDSVARHAQATSLLTQHPEPIGINTIQAILSDHATAPSPICRHPAPDAQPHQTSTVASTVFDLTNGQMVVTAGPPCMGASVTTAFPQEGEM